MNRTLSSLQGMQSFPDINGHYFEILTGGPVDVYFFDKDHNDLAIEKGVSAGYYLDRRGGLSAFVGVDIDFGGVAQNLKVFFTDGTGGQKSASTQITSSVPATGVAITQAKVTVGVASTQLLAANANRKYFAVQNPSGAANSVFIRVDGGVAVADATAFELRPGQTWEPPVVPTSAVNAIAAVANDVNVLSA